MECPSKSLSIKTTTKSTFENLQKQLPFTKRDYAKYLEKKVIVYS